MVVVLQVKVSHIPLQNLVKKVFHYWDIFGNWFFKKCHLIIPSTIKHIKEKVFYGNERCWYSWALKEVLSLEIEEGVETIGKEAFTGCKDLKSNKIKFPNSLKYIDEFAFRHTNITELDLTTLDHVIELSCDINSPNGIFTSLLSSSTNLEKIYVKDETTKAKYCVDKKWKSVSNKIIVKNA